MNLTHFYYAEWPGGASEVEGVAAVPSSTHGLLGLVEHALAHQEEASLTGPIAVHCRSDQPTLPWIYVDVVLSFGISIY